MYRTVGTMVQQKTVQTRMKRVSILSHSSHALRTDDADEAMASTILTQGLIKFELGACKKGKIGTRRREGKKGRMGRRRVGRDFLISCVYQ